MTYLSIFLPFNSIWIISSTEAMSTQPDHIQDQNTSKFETEHPDKNASSQDNSEPEEKGHVSAADILSGNATHELTHFEAKAALINA
jgi:hypothetical protein